MRNQIIGSAIVFFLFNSLLIVSWPRKTEANNPYLNQLLKTAKQKNLHASRYWRLLLHYRQGLWGLESEVDSEDFFLARDGKTNPESELTATIKAFFQEVSSNAPHPQCRFIARFNWLKKELQLDPNQIKIQPCIQYNAWISRFNVKSATLVFPTYDLTSLGSMFGHTFLRLDSSQSQSNLLLSLAVSYAAFVPEDISGVNYIYKGLSGGFDGFFFLNRYYEKVREYNREKSRDMWEYDLNLNKEEIERMLSHLWELKHIHFDYYFLSENCSYHLLSLIETARPSVRLREDFKFGVIPVNTVRAVKNAPGLIVSRSFRSSQYRTALNKTENLEESERALLEIWIEHHKMIPPGDWKNRSIESKAGILDAFSEYLLFKIDAENSALKAERFKVMEERASLGRVEKKEVAYLNPTPPENGHETTKIAFGWKTQNETQYMRLLLRPALHDIMDYSPGFPEYGSVEFGKVQIRYSEAGGVQPDELALVNAVSMVPVNIIQRKLSWKIFSGVKWQNLEDCSNCPTFNTDLNAGYSAEVSSFLFYLLGGIKLKINDEYKNDFQCGPVITGGMITNWSQTLKAGIIARQNHLFGGEPVNYYEWDMFVNYAVKTDLELRLFAFQDSIDENGRDAGFGLDIGAYF